MTSLTGFAGALPDAHGRSPGLPLRALALGAAWLALAGATYALPEDGDFPTTAAFAAGALGFGLVLPPLVARSAHLGRAGASLAHWTPWLTLLALALTAWELITAKFALLPMPFFPPPQAILEVFLEDWPRLGGSILASLKLLAGGYLIGAGLGFVLGVAIGWSKAVGYWAHPILRFVGPLPATAWLPMAFFVFPSSWSASTFLIALATGFPVTVLTWSGVAGVNKAYFDVARTLGASPAFLVLRVAVPAALPHVFVGLFMGLGGAFAVLVVAEMLGVKSGLGWYLQWAQGWAAYANMYAALIVMALMCSGLITLLFRLRDRVLSWQKGLVQW
ncbi:UNVERIFIED_ORG: NitT/TauT family transport system permease protein [Methylobacterium sp. SuP10 SLI 274]|uniref:ABC transporter permease n=1 Tax=Methylorubrum extorquens TaxID=408 RepID=UPI00209E9895|nr:ABC transporter permease subunit [Methylorubrum extorquens]MDF9861507.1 NitT/TauT family transport system permease protein [Methylorubrum pseudosasae]MDH6635132.1 NitT/TauT family transport system permease protein [Methylobacterium sp. SuP10 SLI 274]MDH6664305.1 NitT/TauT family transport system permease protein [Methylorubrum zatmanii]MCP1561306.1 NitT/TauT family transport system permease protein [Methylorubrum extorquens]MDF9789799.1 NitT/TauT family transport system permease protein [Me